MKNQNMKKAVRTFVVLLAVFVLACALSSVAFAEDAAAAAAPDINQGLGLLAGHHRPIGVRHAALAMGIAAIGSGIAVGAGAPAAIGALTEDPKSFGKALIFVALGEGIALYGMLVAILIWTKV